jgi:hypothetical protein
MYLINFNGQWANADSLVPWPEGLDVFILRTAAADGRRLRSDIFFGKKKYDWMWLNTATLKLHLLTAFVGSRSPKASPTRADWPFSFYYTLALPYEWIEPHSMQPGPLVSRRELWVRLGSHCGILDWPCRALVAFGQTVCDGLRSAQAPSNLQK